VAEKDPFSQCYDLLKSLIFNNNDIARLIRPANAMMFTREPGRTRQVLPLKAEISEGDLPEWRLLPTGGTPKVGRSSDHSSWLQKYSMQIATGDLDVEAEKGLFPLSFALWCAWASWAPMFASLTFHDTPFVHLAQAIEATQGIAIENENRGIRGWATVWQVQVDIWLPTVLMQTFNTIQ